MQDTCFAGEFIEFISADYHLLECENHIAGIVYPRYYLTDLVDCPHVVVSFVVIPFKLHVPNVE
jgi:hypothetical protein